MLIVHLFVRYAHVNLCHCFSSSWYQGLAATSACGSSWTFLFTFFQYLGIDRIIGRQAISKLLLSRPLLGGCSYAYACVRESVCICSQLSHLISQPPQHIHQCNARLGIRWRKQGKCNRQCACTYNTISLRTQRKRRDVWSLQQLSSK